MFTGIVDELNIKSEDLRKFFQKHKIVPHLHIKYKDYFTHSPPEIALTYQWVSTFRELRAFLCRDNIRRHNSNAIDPNPSFWERLYQMFFLWIPFGPLALIPEDIDEKTIFIDILLNDQNSIDIKQELDAAEQQYMWASLHIILATSSVLTRAWCLYEIAARRSAGGKSQLLMVSGENGAEIGQLQLHKVGPLGLLKMVLARAFAVLCVPLLVGGAVLRLMFGTNVWREFPSGSAYFSMFAVGISDDVDFFSSMQASVESDKALIKERALEVYSSEDLFNCSIMAATVRCDCSRLELVLLLWLEALLVLAGLATHFASGVLSLLLTVVFCGLLLCLRETLCSKSFFEGCWKSTFGEPPQGRSGASRTAAAAFNLWLIWLFFDMFIQAPLFAAIVMAVAPVWGMAAGLALSLGLLADGMIRLCYANHKAEHLVADPRRESQHVPEDDPEGGPHRGDAGGVLGSSRSDESVADGRDCLAWEMSGCYNDLEACCCESLSYCLECGDPDAESGRGWRRWEMAIVLVLALATPVVAPLAVLAVLVCMLCCMLPGECEECWHASRQVSASEVVPTSAQQSLPGDPLGAAADITGPGAPKEHARIDAVLGFAARPAE